MTGSAQPRIEPNEIGIKQARIIVANHYGVCERIAARKLLKLFPHTERKSKAVIDEAMRIVSLRSALDISDGQCVGCGRVGNRHTVKPREGIILKTPKQLSRFYGWKPWRIDAPCLCTHCWQLAAMAIHQYRELIDLMKLCSEIQREIVA